MQEQRLWIERGMALDGGLTGLDNYRVFYPLMDKPGENSRITALRLVFAPYQVGSWADGTWQVDMPVQMLPPYALAHWQDLLVPDAPTTLQLPSAAYTDAAARPALAPLAHSPPPHPLSSPVQYAP